MNKKLLCVIITLLVIVIIKLFQAPKSNDDEIDDAVKMLHDALTYEPPKTIFIMHTNKGIRYYNDHEFAVFLAGDEYMIKQFKYKLIKEK